MLAAGIVQETFAGEAVEGKGDEEETTGGYFYWYLYWYFYRSGSQVKNLARSHNKILLDLTRYDL